MGRLRYIGSKARVCDDILDIIGRPTMGRFVDVFSGTGIVGRGALLRGWEVWANDYLPSSAIITAAHLFSIEDVPFGKKGGYGKAIEMLNSVEGTDGFVYREYSPSGCSLSGQVRKYFAVENARKIDGIRQAIGAWFRKRIISQKEAELLIADLIEASNRVANISGTYGCFLKELSPAALRPIRLVERSLHPVGRKFRVTSMDAFLMRVKNSDVIYLDPPYTKRQYAAYYHLLDTIALADAPQVSGVTGLRPWRHKSSPFCFKKQALSALMELIGKMGAKRVALSYSSEGHISLDSLQAQFGLLGKTKVHKLASIGRYRPNAKASKSGDNVFEYLITCEITTPASECIGASKKKEVYLR